MGGPGHIQLKPGRHSTDVGLPQGAYIVTANPTMCRGDTQNQGEGARRLLASRSERMHRAVATNFLHQTDQCRMWSLPRWTPRYNSAPYSRA